jgi:hypothetical protein
LAEAGKIPLAGNRVRKGDPLFPRADLLEGTAAGS